ncbi:MAG: aminoglycoside phosphotransferase family protein [Pseudomonadota bacterium]
MLPDTRLDPIRAALRAGGHPAASSAFVPLAAKGLAHDHLRCVGTGWLLRIPRQSQLNLPPAEALAYEAACFTRASASGCTPALALAIPAAAQLPWGALLVRDIEGRAARLPQDLHAIARTLAALHALPLPAPAERPPLLAPADALAALLHELEAQARQGEVAGLPAAAAHAIRDGLRQLRERLAQPHRPTPRLIAFDTHPGNFVVDAQGKAWLVDLEKCRYAYPGLDLAHATLHTSTTWDVESRASLSVDEVVGFYAAWAQAAGPELAADARPWHAPLRHAMWLWSLTWCAMWHARAPAPPDGDDALMRHVRERVGHYLSKDGVERVRQELRLLDALWAA